MLSFLNVNNITWCQALKTIHLTQGKLRSKNQGDSHKAVSEINKTKMSAEQNMTQAITKKAVETNKPVILVVTEVDNSVNKARLVHAAPKPGIPNL